MFVREISGSEPAVIVAAGVRLVFDDSKEKPLLFAMKLALDDRPYDPSSPVRYRIVLICIASSVSPNDPPRTVDSVFHEVLMSSTQGKIFFKIDAFTNLAR